MTKAKDKIMKMDFKKRIKQLLIAMVCVVLAGGGAVRNEWVAMAAGGTWWKSVCRGTLYSCAELYSQEVFRLWTLCFKKCKLLYRVRRAADGCWTSVVRRPE